MDEYEELLVTHYLFRGGKPDVCEKHLEDCHWDSDGMVYYCGICERENVGPWELDGRSAGAVMEWA